MMLFQVRIEFRLVRFKLPARVPMLMEYGTLICAPS